MYYNNFNKAFSLACHATLLLGGLILTNSCKNDPQDPETIGSPQQSSKKGSDLYNKAINLVALENLGTLTDLELPTCKGETHAELWKEIENHVKKHLYSSFEKQNTKYINKQTLTAIFQDKLEQGTALAQAINPLLEVASTQGKADYLFRLSSAHKNGAITTFIIKALTACYLVKEVAERVQDGKINSNLPVWKEFITSNIRAKYKAKNGNEYYNYYSIDSKNKELKKESASFGDVRHTQEVEKAVETIQDAVRAVFSNPEK